MKASSPPTLSSWFERELSCVLKFDGTKEISDYILSLPTAEEQDSYLQDMLDPSNRDHADLLIEFTEKREEFARRDEDEAPPPGIAKVYRKKALDVEEGRKKKESAAQVAPPKTEDSGRKGKTNYRNLYEGSAGSTQMPGRHACECQARKHDLVSNCVSCGRIVCAQEGSGPCVFCGSLVVTREEQEVLDRGSKKSDALRKKLLADAENHRNRLLDYDKAHEKRTKVIDDESDYFSVDSNKWLSGEQREKLRRREEEIREKRHGSRLNRKMDFDFAGRKVVEKEDGGAGEYDPAMDDIVKKIMEEEGNAVGLAAGAMKRMTMVSDSGGLVNPNLNVPRPTLVPSDQSVPPQPSSRGGGSGPPPPLQISKPRLQDAQLQEMSDAGACLTMHQPYASLLVMGIKVDEGRNWYSAHRGRLWIHAASKAPSDEEVRQVQDFYKARYGSKCPAFPSTYPNSCLLGSVDIDDCLSQEDYREKYQDGESASPYVFVCKNHQELLVKFPMSGQHKIYKLDPQIHQAAKKSVKRRSGAPDRLLTDLTDAMAPWRNQSGAA